MKRERKVFGRRKFAINGELYTFELRRTGLFVRGFHKRREFLVPAEHLLRLCGQQTELFTQKDMSRQSEGQLINPLTINAHE